MSNTPFLVKGGFLKSRNQYFNKKRAELVSILTKGKEDAKHPETRALKSLSAKRDRFLRDCFYKVSHRIAREATQRTCGKIVIGKNVMQKQAINTGHVNNQNFVQLPIAKFIDILTIVCLKYGIEVIRQEESYTSKASFFDRDRIPTYGDGDIPPFSGKRVRRGLYRAADGTLVNADVNGSLNIGRKYDPTMFDRLDDTKQFLSTEVLNFEDFYKGKNKTKVAAVTRSRSRVSGS